MSKKKLEKPTKAMRSRAWATLAEVADNPDAADHARVSAARALVRDDPAAAEAAEAAKKRPQSCVFLPDNGRDPGITRLGIYDIDCQTVIIYDGSTEEGLADLARWQAQMAARIEADYPRQPLALSAPAPKRAQTGAERQRKRRARLKVAAAAKLAA